MKIDLMALADEIVRDNGLAGLAPVVEKEIVHHEILRTLSRTGMLNQLTFQGGTCLRLCYGSLRYSEDLDFTAGDRFDEIDVRGFTEALSRDLMGAYDVEVSVREPKVKEFGSGVGMRRWTVVVNTAPERADLPSQRIKLEIASVPSYTSEVRQVDVHYPGLPDTYRQTLVRCQRIDEILADKLISFANTGAYVRHRDLWDMGWIMSDPALDAQDVPDLLMAKHGDYGCEDSIGAVIARGLDHARKVMASSEFASQMRRFLPPETFEATVDRPQYREAMLKRVEAAYQSAARSLGVEDGVKRAMADMARAAASQAPSARLPGQGKGLR